MKRKIRKSKKKKTQKRQKGGVPPGKIEDHEYCRDSKDDQICEKTISLFNEIAGKSGSEMEVSDLRFKPIKILSEISEHKQHSEDYVNDPSISMNIFQEDPRFFNYQLIGIDLDRTVPKSKFWQYYLDDPESSADRDINQRVLNFIDQLRRDPDQDTCIDNLDTGLGKCSIIVSHNEFMKLLIGKLEDMKNSGWFSGEQTGDIPEITDGRNLSKQDLNNLDCLLIMIDENKILSNWTIAKNSSNYLEIKQKIDDIDPDKIHCYLIFRHCPACHNLEYGWFGRASKIPRMGWDRLKKGVNSNTSLSMCLNNTVSDYFFEGTTSETKFDGLIESISIKFDKRNILFYSSIIFRAFVTCLLIQSLFLLNL